jgi:hypothetical protein
MKSRSGWSKIHLRASPISKNFSGGYTPDPHDKVEGREGGEGKRKEGKGNEGKEGRGREGWDGMGWIPPKTNPGYGPEYKINLLLRLLQKSTRAQHTK